MTFFGKFFVLLNTLAAFALLSWGFSIYTNRVDWTEVQEGDKKLTERTKELADAVPPAQRDLARLLNATATAEVDLEKRREQIQKRLAEAETGTIYDVNKDNSLLAENLTEADKIKGLNGDNLRGTTILLQDLATEVDNAATAAKQFDDTRKQQSTLSDEIAGYDKKAARLKLLLKDLREEEIFLADSRVNWDEQLVTLQKRNKQLQDKLAAIAQLQKELKGAAPASTDTALRPIVK